MNEDIAPYTCFKCGNRVGLSTIEPNHKCEEPFFYKDGSITLKFKSVYGKNTHNEGEV